MEKELLSVLKRIKKMADNGNIASAGICRYVYKFLDSDKKTIASYHIMYNIWRNWPKFSGSIEFPVLGESEYYGFKNKWEGEPGKLRRELLDFLIQQLENDLQAPTE